MPKRRISNGTVADIGMQRIDTLMRLSEEAVRNGRDDRARRYVELARRIGMKTRVSMPKDRRYCKKCHLPLIPGVSCTVRLNSHKVCTTCVSCKTVRRYPYIKEQRE